MQDSTKIMSLVALSNRYREAISRLDGAVAEALNEIQFCDFLYSPSYNEGWPQFVSAKKSVAEADNIMFYINELWYEIAITTASTSSLPACCVMVIFAFSGPLPEGSLYQTLQKKLDAELKHCNNKTILIQGP